MSAQPVLSPMNLGSTCSHSGVSIPECCCRSCHLEQLRRYAPVSLNHRAPILGLQAPIIPLERYADALGISVTQLKRDAQRREVEL